MKPFDLICVETGKVKPMMNGVHETTLDNLDKLHEAQPDWPMPEWYVPKDRRISQDQREYDVLMGSLKTVDRLIEMEREQRRARP